MATIPNPIPTPAPPGRVVRPLVLPGVPAAPGAADAASIGEARSPIWRNWIDTEAQTEQSVALLKTINDGVGALLAPAQAIAGGVGRIVFPARLDVTAGLAAEAAAIFERSAAAIESLAATAVRCCPEKPDGCDIETISNRAFAIIARIGTLRGHLMDRHDVTLRSVIAKLERDEKLVAEIAAQLQAAELEDAAALFALATDAATFVQWQQDDVAETDPRLFGELNRRVALLLAVECQVAHQVPGDSPDWPPSPPPIEDSGPAAARARKTAR